MMTTPELRKLLLQELSTEHDLLKFCLKWDISNLSDYNISLTGGSETVKDELPLETSTPAGYNSPRTRKTHHSDFG